MVSCDWFSKLIKDILYKKWHYTVAHLYILEVYTIFLRLNFGTTYRINI